MLGQLRVERAADTKFRAYANRSALCFDDPLREGEPQPSAFVVFGRARIELLELDEQPVLIFHLDADAPVLHLEAEVIRALGADAHFDAAVFVRKLDGV